MGGTLVRGEESFIPVIDAKVIRTSSEKSRSKFSSSQTIFYILNEGGESFIPGHRECFI